MVFKTKSGFTCCHSEENWVTKAMVALHFLKLSGSSGSCSSFGS